MVTAEIPGTFQVSTDPPRLDIKPVDSSDANQSSHLQFNDTQIRIDGSEASVTPHFRAVQLSDFTNWLKQQQIQSAESIAIPGRTVDSVTNPTAAPTAALQPPGISTERLYRMDDAEANRINRQLKGPNFDTRNYVEPADVGEAVTPDSSPGSGSTLGLAESDPPIPGSPRLAETVMRLKADGRIMGDLNQPSLPSDRGMQIPAFQWPTVTSGLLNSPAMINLETNIQPLLTATRNQILVTSSARGSGSTTVTLALARQLAQQGKQILLIDADIESPMLAKCMGVVHQRSWASAVANHSDVAELVVSSKSEPVSLLPLSPMATRIGWPRQIFDWMFRIAGQIAWNYDAVLFDTGPVDQWIRESSSPISHQAATLLVNGDANAAAASDQSTRELMQYCDSEVIVVQNFSSVKSVARTRCG